FARLGRRRLGLDQLDPQAPEPRLAFGDARRGDRFALAGLGQPRPRRLDDFGELAILAGEEHLLPAAQPVAQPLVAPRLAGLALQRPALLFHLEDDVIDPGEVLLRGLE